MASIDSGHRAARGASGGSARSGRPQFSDLSLLGKILSLAVLAAAVALVVGIVAQNSLSAVSSTSSSIVVDDAKPALQLSQASLRWANYRGMGLALVLARTPATIKVADDNLQADKQMVDTVLTGYVSATASSPNHDAAVQLQQDVAAAEKVFEDQIYPTAKTTTTPDGIAALAAKTDAVFTPVANKASQEFDALVATNSAHMDTQLSYENSTGRHSTGILWTAILLGVALVMVLGVLLARMIVRPIVAVRDALRALADGDLTSEVVVHSRDEVGQMAEALGQAQLSLREAMATISSSSGTLAGSAEELSAVSAQVAASAEETSSQSGTAAAAAEQVSRNVQTVAAATEQMSASIREISQSSADAVRVAQSAAIEAQQANATVAKLGDSSREIGDVVKVITSIAEQTNLLALNATIEAARAGEAGKGFAVVASEVKDLAQETARATDDISRRIDAIQTDTEAAVQAIERISQIIDEVNNYQTTIASAVEEQTATTSEMSRNVSDAATGSQSIAENIEYVATSAQSSSSGIGEAQRAASELAQLSTELRELVGRFRI